MRISTYRFFISVSLASLSIVFHPLQIVADGSSRSESSMPRAKGPETIHAQADQMDFDQASGDMILRGHAVVAYRGDRIFADQIRANSKTKQTHADGHVRLYKGTSEWKTESLDYNFGTGRLQTATLRSKLDSRLYFEAQSAESRDANRYLLKDSWVTTSDYEKPGWKLKASAIEVTPEDKIALHHIVMYVGSVPLFYFPYLVIPIGKDSVGANTGTQVQVGQRGDWGFFVLNSYTTTLSQGIHPTFRFDYRTERGFAGGFDLRYRVGDRYVPPMEKEFEPNVSGKIRTYYAHDEKARRSGDVDVVGVDGVRKERIPRERYQIRVTQRAQVTEETEVKLKVNKISDPNFLESYYEREFQRDPQPDNFFEVAHWMPHSTLSLLGRAQVNSFYTTTERLPEIHYDLNRQKLFDTPLFYESKNSVAQLSKEFAPGSGFQDFEARRVDTFHQILYPKQYFGWLNFAPRVGGRATFYDRSQISGQPEIVRGIWNAGFEAGFKASRTWKSTHDKQWNIDGLRHLVEPSINYGFVSAPTHGPSEIFPFDISRSSFGVDKNLVPIDFPQYTGIDSIDSRNVVRPLLRQRLQTRRKGSTVDLAELTFYQDILATRLHDEKTFSDLFAEFRASPVSWLSLGWLGRYNYDENQLRESTTSFQFLLDRDWKFGFNHQYFRGVASQIGTDVGWSINENWALRVQHRFDPTTGELFEQAYSLDRDLHSWIMSLNMSQLRPLNREPELRFWLSFTLKAFPEAVIDSGGFGHSNSPQ